MDLVKLECESDQRGEGIGALIEVVEIEREGSLIAVTIDVHRDGFADNNLSFVYMQKGMYDQALDEFAKLAPLRGILPETAAALRRAYTKSGITGFYRKTIELEDRGVYPELGTVGRAAIYAKQGRAAAVTVFHASNDV